MQKSLTDVLQNLPKVVHYLKCIVTFLVYKLRASRVRVDLCNTLICSLYSINSKTSTKKL